MFWMASNKKKFRRHASVNIGIQMFFPAERSKEQEKNRNKKCN